MNHGDGEKFLQLIPAEIFRNLCLKHGVYNQTRSFEPWDHLSCLVLTQVLDLKSLRDIETILGVKRSTLSDANADRPVRLFEDLVHEVFKLNIDQNKKLRKAYRRILGLDSTECLLNGRLKGDPFFCSRSATAMKVHVVWNIGEEWIEDFRITGGNVNDQTLAHKLSLARGATYVFDRGYPDIKFWYEITQYGSHFVSRLKKTTEMKIDHLFRFQKKNKDQMGVLLDQNYYPTSARLTQHPEIPKNIKFRHIVYRDSKSKKIFDFITSDFETPAQKIADIYQARWSVELLFRWLKQHLQFRKPAYRNKNAISIHLTVSLLIRLLVELFRRKNEEQATAAQTLRRVIPMLWRRQSFSLWHAPPQENSPKLRLAA